MSSKLARHIDHCAQHLCPSCPSLECSFFTGAKDEWAHERQMDCQPSFFCRQTISKPLLHCLLAQQHHPTEHLRSGLQITPFQISYRSTLHDGLPTRLGERAAVAINITYQYDTPTEQAIQHLQGGTEFEGPTAVLHGVLEGEDNEYPWCRYGSGCCWL